MDDWEVAAAFVKMFLLNLIISSQFNFLLWRVFGKQYSYVQILTCSRHGGGHGANEGLLLHLLILTICHRYRSSLRYNAPWYLQQILVRRPHRRLAISWRDSALSPPFDESHSIPDGLSNYFQIAVQEKTWFYLQYTGEMLVVAQGKHDCYWTPYMLNL